MLTAAILAHLNFWVPRLYSSPFVFNGISRTMASIFSNDKPDVTSYGTCVDISSNSEYETDSEELEHVRQKFEEEDAKEYGNVDLENSIHIESDSNSNDSENAMDKTQNLESANEDEIEIEPAQAEREAREKLLRQAIFDELNAESECLFADHAGHGDFEDVKTREFEMMPNVFCESSANDTEIEVPSSETASETSNKSPMSSFLEVIDDVLENDGTQTEEAKAFETEEAVTAAESTVTVESATVDESSTSTAHVYSIDVVSTAMEKSAPGHQIDENGNYLAADENNNLVEIEPLPTDAFARMANRKQDRRQWYEKGLEFGVNFRVLSGERVDIHKRIPFVPRATQAEVLLSKFATDVPVEELSDKTTYEYRIGDPVKVPKDYWMITWSSADLTRLETMHIQAYVCAALNSRLKMKWLIGVRNGKVEGCTLGSVEKDLISSSFVWAIGRDFSPPLDPSLVRFRFVPLLPLVPASVTEGDEGRPSPYLVEISVNDSLENTFYQLSSGRIYHVNDGLAVQGDIEDVRMRAENLMKTKVRSSWNYGMLSAGLAVGLGAGVFLLGRFILPRTTL